MEGFTHEDYVAAALTTLQIEQRFSVWHPPEKLSEQLFDICTRFCDMSRDDAAAFVAEVRELEQGPIVSLEDLSVTTLTFCYGFDIRKASQLCHAAFWVDVRCSLRRMKTPELEDIVQGAKIK
jgi:hypothetical protein